MVTIPHPTLPEFDYIRPKTLAEASCFLAEHGPEARAFSGGTDVFVRMRDGALPPKFLVDVKNLDGMRDLRFDPLSGLIIGAAVSMNAVISAPEVQAHYPLLAEACRSVASYQLRTRATIAGNICNASPAGDSIGACLALDASLCIHGTAGARRETLAGFFLGPGKTRLQPGDIVTAVCLPPPPPGCAGVYLKLGRNRLSDLSIVGLAALGSPNSDCPSGYRFRIVLASVAPVPLVAGRAEAYLAEHPATPDAFRQAAQLAYEECAPIDDVRSSARYRKLMVRNLTESALSQVWQALHP